MFGREQLTGCFQVNPGDVDAGMLLAEIAVFLKLSVDAVQMMLYRFHVDEKLLSDGVVSVPAGEKTEYLNLAVSQAFQ